MLINYILDGEFFEPYEGLLFKVKVLDGKVSMPESYPYCIVCGCQFVNQNLRRLRYQALVFNCPEPCNKEFQITEEALTAKSHAVKSLVEGRLRKQNSALPQKSPTQPKKFSVTKQVDGFLHNMWGRLNIREQVAAQIVKGVFWVVVTLLGLFFYSENYKNIHNHQLSVTSYSSDATTNNQNILINNSPGTTVVQQQEK